MPCDCEGRLEGDAGISPGAGDDAAAQGSLGRPNFAARSRQVVLQVRGITAMGGARAALGRCKWFQCADRSLQVDDYPDLSIASINSRVRSGEWRGQLGKLLLWAGALSSSAQAAGRTEPALENIPISVSRLSPCGSWQPLTLMCCIMCAHRHVYPHHQHRH